MTSETQRCVRKLKSFPPEEGIAMLESMAKARKPKSDQLLLEMFSSRSVWVREQVLNSLWEFGKRETARKIARAGLQDRNFAVRNSAAEALGEVGTAQDASDCLFQCFRPTGSG